MKQFIYKPTLKSGIEPDSVVCAFFNNKSSLVNMAVFAGQMCNNPDRMTPERIKYWMRRIQRSGENLIWQHCETTYVMPIAVA